MPPPLPPLLEPYLSAPPSASLLLLTGVLGASTNWLVLRCLHALLLQARARAPPSPRPAAAAAAAVAQATPLRARSSSSSPPSSPLTYSSPPTRVVLLSLLRDYSFWRQSAARLGLDLDALGRGGRFAFIDGLGLFCPPAPTTAATATAAAAAVAPAARPSVPGPAQGSRTAGNRQAPAPAKEAGAAAWGRHALASPTLEGLARALHGVVDDMARQDDCDGTVVLVIDQLDFLLAAAGGEGSGLSALGLQDMLLGLREKVHATILTLSADEPLVAAQTTSLEREHAALVLGLAHDAEMVLSLRLLDTGVAKDVSGVVRITRGGGGSARAMDENEYLYHVGGDHVRVFERGQ